MREIITTPTRCVYVGKVSSRHYDNNKWASIKSYKTEHNQQGSLQRPKKKVKLI